MIDVCYNSILLEIAVLNILFALGGIFFGHFEEHTPKHKRIVKYVGIHVITIGTSLLYGRSWFLIELGVLLTMVIIIHAIILPAKGINGLTGEPKEKYYRLRGWDDLNRRNQ